MKSLSILALIAFFLGCDSTSKIIETESIESIETQSKPERNIQFKSSIGEFMDSEPFTIHAVSREGNFLFVEVSYLGGCGVHNFKMIGNPAIMKSLPAKRSIMIAHEIPREECKDVVKKILEIDISALALDQSPGSEINLILNNWDEEINYIFE